jgi:competence protein ComGC
MTASTTDPSNPVKESSGKTLAILGLSCCGLFVLLLILAGISHPDISPVLIIPLLAMPPLGMTFGILARKKASPTQRGRARTAMTLSFVEIVLLLLASILMPALCGSREQANRIKCASNMRMIFFALDDYAKKHDGLLPPALDALLTSEDITADTFVCPSGTVDRAPGATAKAQAAALGQDPAQYCSYVFVAGGLKLDEAAQPPRVLLYEPLSDHKDGMDVLYSDGTVEYVPETKAQQIIASLSSPATKP